MRRLVCPPRCPSPPAASARGACTCATGGRGGAPRPADFAPSNHRPGEHGDLYACARLRHCASARAPGRRRPPRPLPGDARRRLPERGARPARDRPAAAGSRSAATCPPAACSTSAAGTGCCSTRRAGSATTSPASSSRARRRGYARDVLGLDVAEATLEAAATRDARYDVVVLADVIEHLDDPSAALDGCASLLADGGVLCVVTPDPASATARVAGDALVGPRPRSHVPAPAPDAARAAGRDGAGDLRRRPARALVRAALLARRPVRARRPCGGRLLRALGSDRARRAAPSRCRSATSASCSPTASPVARAAQPLARGEAGSGVTVVLPAYQAADTIPAVAAQIPVDAVDRALLVDDASPDETSAVALRSGLRRAAPSRQPRLRRQPEDVLRARAARRRRRSSSWSTPTTSTTRRSSRAWSSRSRPGWRMS